MTATDGGRPVYAHPPEKVDGVGWRRLGMDFIENVFFGVVTVLAFAFGLVLLRQGGGGWATAGYLLCFWGVMSYLALPRLHRVLSSIYVPDYFIGRARTGDGLLGDPINLALTGDAEQIHSVMRAAGWTVADPVTVESSWRIVAASLTRRSYPQAPVSPLLLFGRVQAFAYQQEVEGNPAQRHHVRFWPCPQGWLLPGGHRVDWLAAGTYDRAVGLSLFTGQVTHKIDRDIDVERDYIVATLRHAEPSIGVHVLEDFSTGYHSRNGGGDEVSTDGDLPVVDVCSVTVTEARSVAPSASAGAGAVQRSGLAGSTPSELLHQVGRRPFSVVAAWLLTLVSTVISLGALGLNWSQHGLTESAAADEVPGAIAMTSTMTIATIVIIAVAIVYGVILWLGWRTYRGGQYARLVLVGLVTASQVGQMMQYLGGERPTVAALAQMSVDLLTVYALTSLSAREWTRTRGGRGSS